MNIICEKCGKIIDNGDNFLKWSYCHFCGVKFNRKKVSVSEFVSELKKSFPGIEIEIQKEIEINDSELIN